MTTALGFSCELGISRRDEDDGTQGRENAAHYQHPELEIVRAALDYTANSAQIRV